MLWYINSGIVNHSNSIEVTYMLDPHACDQAEVAVAEKVYSCISDRDEHLCML